MGYYDEIEIEDMDYDEELQTYFYPCPCGDKFQITLDDLLDGIDEAHCPSCSLVIKVIYEDRDLEAIAPKISSNKAMSIVA